MNPAPTLLDEWITNAAFWWFMLIAATTAVVWLLASLITAWRAEDAEPAPAPHAPPPLRECQITGCPWPPTHRFNLAADIYTCTTHAHMVQDWAGPYDQELDQATDLGQWNKEMDAS